MTVERKKLRSLTIVPDELYVTREADRQLERTIKEMGRPSYILVARQMGKTNLLLHMKRRREAEGDVVCYFDLSTRHTTLQAFFRAIIDVVGKALKAHAALKQIDADRAQEMQPNVEFDLHLRLLLNSALPERLIVVLDEIDSLIGVPYSDKVLAQIRSMYFARENHSIYERLTYVLSGVAEPTDLIKDKNISPFNIGEKIYLENFSLSELFNLIRQANVTLGPSLVERVFYWTAGNPRMSWEIFAALEDAYTSGEALDLGDVDRAVERVYLRDFDRAPVDHVRTLVRSDPSMRDALMSLHYGNTSSLDDAMRSRLFLAGITDSARPAPAFNNRVIAEALSTDWLTQLASGHASAVETASRLYREHDYSGAVRLFERYLEDAGATFDALDQGRLMQFGIALYHVRRFADAQRRLESALGAAPESEFRKPILFYLASAKLQGGDADGSIGIFEEVAGQPGEFEYLAKLALAGALITASARTHAPRVLELSADIVARPGALSDDPAIELTSSALFNEALAHVASANRTGALASLERALGIAPSDLMPGIYLKLIDIVDERQAKAEALSRVVTLLERSLPMARRYGSTSLSFSNFTLGALAAKALQIGDEDAAERLVSLAMKSMGEPSLGRVAVRILTSPVGETDHTALRPLIEAGLAEDESQRLSPADVLTLAKAAVISADAKEKQNAFDRYVRLVRVHQNSFTFEEIDGIICVGQVAAEISGLDHSRIRETMRFFDEVGETFLRSQPFFYAFYLNQKLTYYKLSKNDDAARKFASELLNILEDPETEGSDLSDPALESFVIQIQNSARETLAATTPDRFRKIGRNQIVRYLDTRSGLAKVAKFKKVERELRSGLFELVADNSSE